jgi:hypothetical protein
MEAGLRRPTAVVTSDGWKYFTPQEAATVEAAVDRHRGLDDSPGHDAAAD